jgi:hypothetical protein
MKTFFSPPTTEDGQNFYTRYASLVPSLTASGYLSQIVSGLTEWGILYALIYSSLAVFWPEHAAIIGAIGAWIGVAIIEGGLRKLLPFSARAIIKKRWKGLDGWITGFVLATTALLLAASCFLSFAGSRSLVESVAAPPAAATAISSDSTATAEADMANATWEADVAAIRATYDVRMEAVKQSAAATLRRISGQLATVRTKERTSGQNYTTRRSELAEQRADAEADREAQLATLATNREAELAALRTGHRGRLATLTAGRDSTRHHVATANASALHDHQDKVGAYGGGLAWFTVVCLVVLIVSVIVAELHMAGAGIEELAEPDAYTFEGGPLAAFVGAIQARFTRFCFGLVHHIERGTPEAPEPVAAPILWQRANQLSVAKTEDGVERRVKKLKPMKQRKGDDVVPAAKTQHRNQIGFTPNEAKKPLTQPTQLHSDNTMPKPTQETPPEATSGPSRAFLQSRVKMYRQRMGNAQQRADAQNRKRGEVNPKTAAAIENNRQHVEHYSTLLKSLKDEK